MNLKKCPCGSTPNELLITEGFSSKYAFAGGDCCNEWLVEFRTERYDPDSSESMNNAIFVWNNAVRRK